jgi:hypothetical protein
MIRNTGFAAFAPVAPGVPYAANAFVDYFCLGKEIFFNFLFDLGIVYIKTNKFL